eukprot:TRINITY_DN3035_c0_g2_i2.p1 TRINITY_DN3035_c0_g2~~TRINITY_DN3035_c0_g2_i2.p1  ORF type:complete len:1081 (-),score=358.02 TRINITY_DN3035_c0_g2_i2:270-3512(-)
MDFDDLFNVDEAPSSAFDEEQTEHVSRPIIQKNVFLEERVELASDSDDNDEFSKHEKPFHSFNTNVDASSLVDHLNYLSQSSKNNSIKPEMHHGPSLKIANVNCLEENVLHDYDSYLGDEVCWNSRDVREFAYCSIEGCHLPQMLHSKCCFRHASTSDNELGLYHDRNLGSVSLSPRIVWSATNLSDTTGLKFELVPSDHNLPLFKSTLGSELQHEISQRDQRLDAYADVEEAIFGGLVNAKGEENVVEPIVEHSEIALLQQVCLPSVQPTHQPKIKNWDKNYVPVMFPISQKSTVGVRSFNKLKDLTCTEGDFFLFESIEENPLFVSLPGMTSKVRIYHDPQDRKLITNSTFGERCEVPTESRTPFLVGSDLVKRRDSSKGDERNDTQVVSTIYNNMFRAPLGLHEASPTDFLVIITDIQMLQKQVRLRLDAIVKSASSSIGTSTVSVASQLEDDVEYQRLKKEEERLHNLSFETSTVYLLRPIPNIFVVGQQEPKMIVYPTPDKKFVETFVAFHALMIADGDNMCLKEKLQELLPTFKPQDIAAALKPYVDSSKGSNKAYWKFEQRITAKQFKEKLRPEDVCVYESMLLAQNRLLDVGITNCYRIGKGRPAKLHGILQKQRYDAPRHKSNANLFSKQETMIAKYIIQNLEIMPWEVTANYLDAISEAGKVTLNIGGTHSFGDPSGRREAFSFVARRGSQKKTKKSSKQQSSKQQRLQINSIWRKQLRALSTNDDLSSSENEADGDDEEEENEDGFFATSPVPTPMTGGATTIPTNKPARALRPRKVKILRQVFITTSKDGITKQEVVYSRSDQDIHEFYQNEANGINSVGGVTPLSKTQPKTKSKQRICSQCGGAGHTKKTCDRQKKKTTHTTTIALPASASISRNSKLLLPSKGDIKPAAITKRRGRNNLSDQLREIHSKITKVNHTRFFRQEDITGRKKAVDATSLKSIGNKINAQKYSNPSEYVEDLRLMKQHTLQRLIKADLSNLEKENTKRSLDRVLDMAEKDANKIVLPMPERPKVAATTKPKRKRKRTPAPDVIQTPQPSPFASFNADELLGFGMPPSTPNNDQDDLFNLF